MVAKLLDKQQIVCYIYQQELKTERAMNKLLEAIEEYQKRNGLNDSAFCELVGLDPATLSRLKSGQRKAGVEVIRALSQIPELIVPCAEYATGRQIGSAPSLGIAHNAPETHQNQKIAGLRNGLRKTIKAFGRFLR